MPADYHGNEPVRRSGCTNNDPTIPRETVGTTGVKGNRLAGTNGFRLDVREGPPGSLDRGRLTVDQRFYNSARAAVRPGKRRPSGHLLRPRRLDDQTDPYAEPRQHVDQGIGAEQIDATTQEVADARLRDAKHFCCFCLLETS